MRAVLAGLAALALAGCSSLDAGASAGQRKVQAYPRFSRPATSIALGTDAATTTELSATLSDMGRTGITWNVSYLGDTEQVNTALLDAEHSAGVRHHVITLELRHPEIPQLLQAVAGGQLDTSLRRIAGQLAAWGATHPADEVIVRPLHEANGDWYPWGWKDGNNGNSPADFGPAWSHIRSVMRAAYPSLAFFWCPNRLFGSRTSPQTDFATWYPGDSLVEYVGHDGYNRAESDGTWTSPADLHEPTIRAIHQESRRPYVIGETGTSEAAGATGSQTKAAWFTALGTWMATQTFGLTAVCYFDYDKTASNGNDWRVYPQGTADAVASRDAFRAATAGF